MGIRVNDGTYFIDIYTPQNDEQEHTYSNVHFHIFTLYPVETGITYWIDV